MKKRTKRNLKVFFVLLGIFFVVFLVIGLLSQEIFIQDKGQFSVWVLGGGTTGCGKGHSDVVFRINSELLKIKGIGTGNGMVQSLYFNNQHVCDWTTGPYTDNLCSFCQNLANNPNCCPTFTGDCTHYNYNKEGLANSQSTVYITNGRSVGCELGGYTAGCGNDYTFFQEYKLHFSNNAFNFDVSYPLTTYFVGEDIEITVKINNNAMPVKARVGLEVTTPSPLGGLFKDVQEGDVVDLPVGDSEYVYTFTVTKAIDTLDVHPYIIVYLTPDIIETGGLFWAPDDNWNEDPWFYAWGGACVPLKDEGGNWAPRSLMEYGKVYGEKVPIMITPQPLYLDVQCVGDNDCPNDYYCQAETGFCLRDDIRELSCYQLGCPFLEGHNYQCTSAGICAETVFIEKKCTHDDNCSMWTGELATKCDIGSGLCIEEHYFTEIFQCNSPDDCPKPCDGINIGCDLNTHKCFYEGECVPQTIGCREVGCAEGYVCNTQRNVCERTILPTRVNWELIITGIIFIIGGVLTALGFYRKKNNLKVWGISLLFGSAIIYLLLTLLT